jgi:hypothetical protein
MKDINELFQDGESIIGYVTLNTGTLLITDGVWSDNLSVSAEEKLSIDLGVDNIRLPVIAAKQGGQRFLLIPLDRGVSVNETQSNGIVAMADMADLPKTPEENAE